MVYRISGPFFFGAAIEVSAVLDRIGQYPREFVLDLSRRARSPTRRPRIR